jgi:HTH-type transcriptional regulator / antitoxin HigA
MNMNIQPIKTEQDYRRVLKEIETLMDAKANSPEGDRLDVLATLAEAWEEIHHPIDAPDPVEAIEFAMDQRGLCRRDLEPYIGSRARVAEVLNRKRSLTLPMIRRLHDGLGIPADVLIREQKTRSLART